MLEKSKFILRSLLTLQKKPSALKREHPALKNMKFLNFFLLLWDIFALLDRDPDTEYGSGSTDLIKPGSKTNQDLETLPLSPNILSLPLLPIS
jgi:hypothetical protein